MSKVAQAVVRAAHAVNAENAHVLDAFNAFVHRGSMRREPLEGLRGDCLREWKVAVKDNIAVEAWPMTCASETLRKFTAPYSAEVVARLLASGAECIGKTNMDEFGMGSRTEHSIFGPTRNPHDPSRSAGGSSGGNAAAVASGLARLAIGSDTGGSVRLPASYTGIVGFKPSWGVLSRWGLVSYAPALDVIGLMARSTEDVAVAFEALLADGPFCNDSTATPLPVLEKGSPHEPFPVEGLIVGIPREWAARITDETASKVFESVIAKLEASGVRLKEVSVPGLSDALALYSDFACAQASSTLARYNGVFFGNECGSQPMWSETGEAATFPVHVAAYQGRNFGPEVLARVKKGQSILRVNGHFERIQERVDVLKSQFARVFSAECCDLVLGPTAPGIAPLLGSRSDADEDLFTVAANLANLPAISLPLHPPLLESFVGTQLLAPTREDRFLLRVALDLERTFA